MYTLERTYENDEPKDEYDELPHYKGEIIRVNNTTINSNVLEKELFVKLDNGTQKNILISDCKIGLLEGNTVGFITTKSNKLLFLNNYTTNEYESREVSQANSDDRFLIRFGLSGIGVGLLYCFVPSRHFYFAILALFFVPSIAALVLGFKRMSSDSAKIEAKFRTAIEALKLTDNFKKLKLISTSKV